MKKLLVYIKDYKKESILGPLFKMLEATLDLLVPLVMAAIIDKGIAANDTPYILRMGLLLVFLGFVGLVFSITAQYFAAKASVGFCTKIRHALFAHIQSLSFSEMDKLGTSTMITRMTSDINQVQSGVNLALRLFLRSPFVVFGAMIVAFTIDVKAAVIFTIVIPLLSIVVFGIMLWSIPQYKRVQAALDKVLGITRENLTGVRVIRAFNKEESEVGRFKLSNEDLTRLQQFVGRVSALMNPVTYIIVNIGTVILIYSGALRVDGGAISQGDVVALVNLMSQILVELVKLANLIITVTKAVACANRIQNVLDIPVAEKPTGVPGAADDSTPIVEFRHVNLTYAGAGDESLTDSDFKVMKGQTVGIIGGTGSGKSSVVNMIPGFYPATAGQVLVDGMDVAEYDPEALRSRIGMVLQKAVLFKGTIRENLAWGNPDASDEDMYRALDIAQAREFVDKKDKGLDSEIAQGGKNLSGGQKQRLTIARAIVRKPDILILDDSASALDFATDAKLRKAIREIDDMTVFIVSQRASSIQYADQIIVLDDGQIAGIGTHDELLAGCDVYQEIYYSQFPKEV
ncbi:MAG: ABC transporter ATP-binding protein [Lachnospiraceae bacterium]|nr:ABC transporter ATP-binding protein [Lachnospiraceae bacterium]